jgi:hypothetical protein
MIDCFNTTGASVNIVNNNSGCNGLPNNYIFYCNPLVVVPGQTVTCNLKSGLNFSQGFAIFIDWNQDNIFQLTSERVAFVATAPPAATWTSCKFIVPLTQANGIYRMRVRSSYSASGNTIDPCTNHSFGECEDYSVYIGITPPGSPPVSISATQTYICPGDSVSISASGATSYTWFPGALTGSNIVVTPTTNTMYHVIGDSSGMCPSLQSVYINVSSSVAAYTTNTLLCSGNSATLTASGAASYSWSTGSSANTIVVTPSSTTTYTLYGTSGSCNMMSTFTQSVSTCTSLEELSQSKPFEVFPNPFSDELIIHSSQILEVRLYNTLGQLIIERSVFGEELLNTTDFPPGLYYLMIHDGSPVKIIKN